jgi:hypothetical protein
MLGQDTGGAIRGVVRADFYWGSGAEAGNQAGKMRSKDACGCCCRAASYRERRNASADFPRRRPHSPHRGAARAHRHQRGASTADRFRHPYDLTELTNSGMLIALVPPNYRGSPTMENFKTSADVLFILLGAIMILAMHAGFAFLELGTVRKKNQVNALVKILCDFLGVDPGLLLHRLRHRLRRDPFLRRRRNPGAEERL